MRANAMKALVGGVIWLMRHYRQRSIANRRQSRENTKMPEWNQIHNAPTDGTWIEVRGWDFGSEESRRHYATARFENGKWVEAGGNQLRYLTDWAEACSQAQTRRRDLW